MLDAPEIVLLRIDDKDSEDYSLEELQGYFERNAAIQAQKIVLCSLI